LSLLLLIVTIPLKKITKKKKKTMKEQTRRAQATKQAYCAKVEHQNLQPGSLQRKQIRKEKKAVNSEGSARIHSERRKCTNDRRLETKRFWL
jgi:hypothetical protein